jgi:hypothetical protein
MSDPDSIPLRPRRRAVTPVRVVLLGVLLVAVGFIGGVEVQKRQGGTSSGASPAGFAQRFGGGGAAAGRNTGASPGGATAGQVASVDGKTLYVTESGGTTVKVRTTSSTKVTRTAVSHVRAVHPGDTVVVQGSTSSSGTVKAARVTATASNASSGLLGGFGGFGGGAQRDPAAAGG